MLRRDVVRIGRSAASMPSSASNSDRNATADRDVETVRLPIEVVAHRPEEVVEVGDLVAQVLDRGDRVLKALVCSSVTAASCCCSAYCCRRMSIDLSITSTCLSRSAPRSCWYGRLLICAALVALIWNGIEVWSSGRAQRPGDRSAPARCRRCGTPPWPPAPAGSCRWDCADRGRLRSSAVRDSAGPGEVPFGGGVTDVGRGAGGHVGPRVVTRLVSGQGEQTDEGDAQRRRRGSARASGRWPCRSAASRAFVIARSGSNSPNMARR